MTNRAVFDYNLVLQNLCNNATKKSLDTVQNHALRFISGEMRSAPIAACEIHKNVRRRRAALERYERSKRLERKRPNIILIDKWRQNQRLKTTSILNEVYKLQDIHHLPEKREPLERVPPSLPPYLSLKKVRTKDKTFGHLQQEILPYCPQSLCTRDD